MKYCEYCRIGIKDKARLCRFCGRVQDNFISEVLEQDRIVFNMSKEITESNDKKPILSSSRN